MNKRVAARGHAHLWLALWLVVIVIGAWLRLHQLHLQVLVDDEWHALHRLMQADWKSIALSFGLADYSIPLTLLFNGLYETTGLHEWHLRALPLLFGLATVLVVPALLSPWLDWRERWLLAALIAISPLLIHYTRSVRPYALVVVLGMVAMVALWRWWHERRSGWALVFVPAAVLAGWLHALTTVYTGAALTWVGIAALVHWMQDGSPRPLLRLLLIGAVTVAACAALILPPLLTTPQAIAEKAGVNQVAPETLLLSWELLVGSAQPLVAVLMLVLVVLGGWQLWLRDRGFLLYWVWLLLASTAVLMLLRPAWIQHALVFVRYNAIIHPVVLSLAAIGMAWLAAALPRWLHDGRFVGAGALLVLVLYLAGPIPELYRGINQFTNATRYQFDYNLERSPFRIFERIGIPALYRDIAQAPGDWEVVEAPWYFETTMSPLPDYQWVHQRRVRIGMMSGLCVDWTWGELMYGDERIGLPQFVFLADLLAGSLPPRNRFVVFHRQLPFDSARELPDVDSCIEAFRDHFGAPWYENAGHVVFRLGERG